MATRRETQWWQADGTYAPLIDVAALEVQLRLLRHVIALGGPSSAGARDVARRIERHLRGAEALLVDEVAEAA